MNRREFISSAGVVGASVAASPVFAGVAGKSTLPTNDALTIVYDCIRAAQVCIEECLSELADGQTEGKAESLRACRDCIAVCEALAHLISSNSAHLKAFAALSAQICRDCERSCDDGDSACRACAEACRRCIAVCETIAAG